jgi:hypothetical protein
MAVNAQQLPVAAVRWVVVMVVIPVVNGQLAQAFALKLASASGTDRFKEFERPLTVPFFALGAVLPRLGDDALLVIAAAGSRFCIHIASLPSRFRRIGCFVYSYQIKAPQKSASDYSDLATNPNGLI